MNLIKWISQCRNLTIRQWWTSAFWTSLATSVVLMTVDTIMCFHASYGERFDYTFDRDYRNSNQDRRCAGGAILQALPHLLLGVCGVLLQKWIPLAAYGLFALLVAFIDTINWIEGGVVLVVVEMVVLVVLSTVAFKLSSMVRKEQRQASRAAREVPTAQYQPVAETIVSFMAT